MLSRRPIVYECDACHGRSVPGHAWGSLVHLYGCPVADRAVLRLGTYVDTSEACDVVVVGDVAAALRVERDGYAPPPWSGVGSGVR